MNTLGKDFELPVLFDDEDGFFIPIGCDEETIKDCLDGIGQNIYLIRSMIYSPEVRKSLKSYFNDEELEKMQDRILEMLRMQ